MTAPTNDADQKEPTDEAAAEAPPAKGSSKGIIVLGALGLTIGLGGGLFLYKPHDNPAAEAKATDHDTALVPAQFHAIENLVVNPAGTNGTRFLLVSASIEVQDAAAEERVRAHETEVRDKMVSLLGSKTISQLTDPGARDSLKVELRESIAALFPPGTVRNIYFPQYVLQ